jgi:hypothetical protein
MSAAFSSCIADNVAQVCNKENLLQEIPDDAGKEEKQDEDNGEPLCHADGCDSAVAALSCRVLPLFVRFHRASVCRCLPPMQ